LVLSSQALSKPKQMPLCSPDKNWFAGICFSEQLVEEVPVSSHDMKVDMVVTDKEIF
jgi:5-formyltetrahydrofolate cyclo-ligase